MKKLIIIAVCLCAWTSVWAQKVDWHVDLGVDFDNRECDNVYCENRTEFLTRLQPEIGLKLPGGHRIAGGVAWIQPVGNGWRNYKLCPTVYYEFRNKLFHFAFGMLPRTKMMEEMPKYLMSDSLRRYQPNIRGLVFQYTKPHGYAEVMLDWRQLQSETQREAFNININTRWRFGLWIVGGRLQINHLANVKNPPEDQSVNDDITVNPYAGIDLTAATPLDTLSLEVGPLINLERDRGSDKGWQIPVGAYVNIAAQWKGLGVRQSIYAGKNLYPLYHKLGAELNMGEPYFQSPFYSRTDLYYKFFRIKYVTLELALSFHAAEKSFGFRQMLTAQFHI